MRFTHVNNINVVALEVLAASTGAEAVGDVVAAKAVGNLVAVRVVFAVSCTSHLLLAFVSPVLYRP